MISWFTNLFHSREKPMEPEDDIDFEVILPKGVIIQCKGCKTRLYEVVEDSDCLTARCMKPMSSDIPQPQAEELAICPVCGYGLMECITPHLQTQRVCGTYKCARYAK